MKSYLDIKCIWVYNIHILNEGGDSMNDTDNFIVDKLLTALSNSKQQILFVKQEYLRSAGAFSDIKSDVHNLIEDIDSLYKIVYGMKNV